MSLHIPSKIIAYGVSSFGGTTLKTAWRNLRGVAKRQPIGSVKTLKGTVKTEYDSGFDEGFESMENMKDLKQMVKQMFVSTDEMTTDLEYNMEEDYDGPVEHAEKYHDMNIQEEKGHKRMVKRNIIIKKYFKEPPETCLLTYAAKMQIRHLHQLDPAEWIPEKIAECFPISVKGAKKFLKTNFELRDQERIKQHDADVAMKWKLLESGQMKGISPVTRKLYLEGKITRDHHAGNFHFSFSSPQKNIPELQPKKTGEHVALIKHYLDLKKKNDTKQGNLETKVTDSSLNDSKTVKSSEHEQRDVLKVVLPEYKSGRLSRKDMETMKSASYLAADAPDPNEIEIPQSQFEGNLLQEFEEKHKKSSVDEAYEEWLQKKILANSESSKQKLQPFDCKDFFETIKKYNRNAIELKVDKSNIYSYDENVGYHYYSRHNTAPRRIKIPKEKYVEGALYRVGKSFYDDDGEFLYKVYV